MMTRRGQQYYESGFNFWRGGGGSGKSIRIEIRL
jgi:hypothetical protein